MRRTLLHEATAGESCALYTSCDAIVSAVVDLTSLVTFDRRYVVLRPKLQALQSLQFSKSMRVLGVNFLPYRIVVR